MSWKIATLPGDGIGPEITTEGVKVLKTAEELLGGFSLDYEFLIAGAKHYRETGVIISDEVWQKCHDADAIYLACMGLPDVLQPDGTEVQGKIIVEMRKQFDLFAGIRPIKLYPNVESPVKGVDKIDFVIMRENAEGLFASFQAGASVFNEVHADTMIITRKGTEKICDYAFRYSQKRNGRPLDGKKVVTCVDKSNNFKGMAFWRKIYNEVADKYPEIGRDYSYVDAITLLMLQKPQNYDVIVAENMFGDIISDLACGLVGGMGMGPSADVGYEHGMFQPSHGSAPTIAGKNIANPIAMILSGAMMLDWLGERNNNANAQKAAVLIEKAVENVLKAGHLTCDIGGNTSTSEIGDYTVEELKKLVAAEK